jgi:hypothetical protein
MFFKKNVNKQYPTVNVKSKKRCGLALPTSKTRLKNTLTTDASERLGISSLCVRSKVSVPSIATY